MYKIQYLYYNNKFNLNVYVIFFFDIKEKSKQNKL